MFLANDWTIIPKTDSDMCCFLLHIMQITVWLDIILFSNKSKRKKNHKYIFFKQKNYS